MVTRDQIKKWLERGKSKDSKYMIVELDDFSYEYYPVYLDNKDETLKRIDSVRSKDMTSIKEVYSYNGDLSSQLEKK